MANKKTVSQAERAAAGSRKKDPSEKKPAEKPEKKEPTPKVPVQDNMPRRLLWAFVCGVLFLLFLLASINPDGAVLRLVLYVVQGFIGKVGFYISIPALLYLLIGQGQK